MSNIQKKQILPAAILFVIFAFTLRCQAVYAQETEEKLPLKLKLTINNLVRELGNDRYRIREAAHKKLKDLLLNDGKNFPSILSYLRQRLKKTDDIEVEVSIGRIIKPYAMFGMTGSLLKKFPGIVEKLTSFDSQVRCRTVRRLGESGHPDVPGLLVHLLDDRDYELKWTAVKALVKMNDTKTTGMLVRLLEDTSGDYEKRSLFAYILACAGGKTALEALIKELGKDDEDMQHVVAEVLACVTNPGAVDRLIKLLEDKNVIFEAREAAAQALGNIRDKKATQPLLKILSDEVEELLYAAAGALGRIRDPKAVEPLIDLFRNEDMDSETRWIAAEALGSIGDARAVAPLIEVLTDEDEDGDVFEAAEMALYQLEYQKRIELHIKMLSSLDPDARWAAVAALPHLIDCCECEEVLNQNTIKKALIEALGDRDWRVRWETARVLEDLHCEDAVEPLIRLLDDSNRLVRKSASNALVCYEDDALEALEDALEEAKDLETKARLQEVIEEIEDF
jgi:HEAT repeat protein